MKAESIWNRVPFFSSFSSGLDAACLFSFTSKFLAVSDFHFSFSSPCDSLFSVLSSLAEWRISESIIHFSFSLTLKKRSIRFFEKEQNEFWAFSSLYDCSPSPVARECRLSSASRAQIASGYPTPPCTARRTGSWPKTPKKPPAPTCQTQRT